MRLGSLLKLVVLAVLLHWRAHIELRTGEAFVLSRQAALSVRPSLPGMLVADSCALQHPPQHARLFVGRHTWQAVGFLLLRPLMHAHCVLCCLSTLDGAALSRGGWQPGMEVCL